MKSLRSQKQGKSNRYFLQIQLLSIKHNPNSFTQPITIKLYKGMQKLDELKEPVTCGGSHTEIEGSLSFYVSPEQNQRTTSFRVVVEGADGKKIGEANLDVSPIINGFSKRGEASADRALAINESTSLEVKVFVERSKQQLSRSICSFSEGRSAYDTRTEPQRNYDRSSTSSRTNDFSGSEKNRNSNTRESNEQPTTRDIEIAEGQSQLLTSEIGELQSKNNVGLKQWQEDEFDSVSMVAEKKAHSKPSGLSTTTVVTFILLFLCLLAFLIVRIQDQKSELSRIIKVTRNVLNQIDEIDATAI